MAENEFFDHNLKTYYKKLFPTDKFCEWLSYGAPKTSDILYKREFSFTLSGDVYLRYQSFQNAGELSRELVKACPHKIDLGAVYSASPKIHRSILSAGYKPVWKELVFDIDLTDYDEIRFCCGANASSSSKALCRLCWQLGQSAVIALDRALREDFGFKHLLWVYSGRRGVHCWVCDKSARYLDNSLRSVVAEYLSVVRPAQSRKQSAFQSGRLLHPSIDAAYTLLKTRFNRYIKTSGGQNILGRPEAIERLLSLIPAEMKAECESLKEEWANKSSTAAPGAEDLSLKRWRTLKAYLEKQNHSNCVKEIVLYHTYPRLDVNVTTGLNHLLKSPFCVHPKTGYVCVPFDPSKIEDFYPDQVPTLPQLIAELESNSEEKHLLPHKLTSLNPYIEFFDDFVQSVCSDGNTESVDDSINTMAF